MFVHHMISSLNPNQAVAFSQGYQTGATAIPIQVRPSWFGNTVIYGFNPLASQVQAWNPAATSAVINPQWAGQAVLTNPLLTQAAVNPVTTGIGTIGAPVIASPALAQQAFANPFVTSGVMSLNTIGTTGLTQMRVDLAETNSDVIVAAELPNVSLNDLSLTVTDDSMSISATAFAGTGTTALYRTIALPTTIRAEQVEATYANGILEIRAPKSDVVSRRKVKVSVAQ